MANLAQLSAIEGAVSGYQQGKMNEQDLQKWLIDFKEQQNQFNQQMGVQQDDLAMRKDVHKRRIQDLDLSYKAKKSAMELGEAAGLTEKEILALAGRWDEEIQTQGLTKTLNTFKGDIYGTREFAEEFKAGELEKAKLGKLGVRGLTADVKGKEAATTITQAEAGFADYFVRQKAKVNQLGIRKGELMLQELQQKVDAMPMETQSKLDFMDAQTRRMDSATTREDYELALNQSMEDIIIRKAGLEADEIVANNNYLEGRTGAIAIELAQRDRDLGMRQQELDDKLRTGATPYSDSRINSVMRTVADNAAAMIDIVKDYNDQATREYQWDALKKSTDAALMSVALIGVWESMTPAEKVKRLRPDEKKLIPPKLLGFRDITPEEKAEILRAPTAATMPAGFKPKGEKAAGGGTTGLTREEQAVLSALQSNEPDIEAYAEAKGVSPERLNELRGMK